MLRMILGSPPVNFKWGLFPWSLGQCNLTRTSVFSFWFKESLMDFWCTLDALSGCTPQTLSEIASSELYLKLSACSFLKVLIRNSYFPNIFFVKCRCIFDAFLMHFWCTFGALLMHFSCAFQKCIKSASKCIKSASKVHQQCIKSV